MPVLVKIGQLVAPLGDDPKRVLEKRNDDQEAANGGKVAGPHV